ncbi:hypothetical protein [Bacilliculturomica massiliensis]|uniref:hypothetical protein n=1 Tax=Bacilliculturomica massiliensis TaxID=1917867 RepID=UPI0010308F1D|nr:hypothetical protein [Bacilliculturomica massiliensis]
MYHVSEAYRRQMEKQTRNPAHVRIVFGLTEPDAPAASTLTDNGALPYSQVNQVDDGERLPKTYETFELNRWVLDKKDPVCPDSEPAYQGYAGDEISDAGGMWSEPPTIIVTFSDYFQLAGLTFSFDESKNEYPTQLEVLAYSGDVEVFRSLEEPGGPYYKMEKRIPSMDRIELRFLKSCRPFLRARLTMLTYGIIENLTAENIVSCKQKIEVDPLSSKLPVQDFEFTRFDTDRIYDPENPSGVWQYLESRQPVEYQFGYELDDGSVEWVPCGKTLSTGDVSIGRTGVVTEITIKTTALPGHLTMTYDQGAYAETGRSLYDLALDVMEFAGYPDSIVLDESLKGVVTTVPLPKKAVNECLQLIANAGRCMMRTRRDGKIEMIRHGADASEFTMNFSKMLSDGPKTEKYPILRKFTTEYQNVSVEPSTVNAVQNAVVEDADSTEIEFTHSLLTDHAAVVSEGLTLHGSRFYAAKSVLTLTGSGTVTITGKSVKSTAVKHVKVCNSVGDDVEMVNELLSTQADAEAYAAWVTGELGRRNQYTADNRGYPELDAGDDILFQTNYENEVAVTIMKHNIAFDGAISGSGEYLIGG